MSTATAKKKGGKQENETAVVGVHEGDNETTEAESEEVETAEEAKAPEITSEELAQKTAEEKKRLEDLLCKESEALTEAAVEFNSAHKIAADKKKHLEAQQLKVNSVVGSLALVLSGNWRPDPQRTLPFPESEVGTQSEIAPALWKSEPIQSLDLPKTLIAKLDQEGFTTVGQLFLELEGQRFAGLEIGEKQITKIQNAVDFVVERAEMLAAEAAKEAAPLDEATQEQQES